MRIMSDKNITKDEVLELINKVEGKIKKNSKMFLNLLVGLALFNIVTFAGTVILHLGKF